MFEKLNRLEKIIAIAVLILAAIWISGSCEKRHKEEFREKLAVEMEEFYSSDMEEEISWIKSYLNYPEAYDFDPSVALEALERIEGYCEQVHDLAEDVCS